MMLKDTSKIELRPYQNAALEKVQYLPSFALFFGTGAGKTFTSLTRVPQNGTTKLLIVCPAKVIPQWETEFPKILPYYNLHKFPNKSTAKEKNDTIKNIDDLTIMVVNYEILYKLENLLRVINNDWTIILDESHKIKDVGTKKSPNKATAFALALGKLTQFKMILTATPTQKDYGGYIDYYSQLKFLGYMPYSYKDFQDRFCIYKKIQPINVPFPINVITGYLRKDELNEILERVAVRYMPKFNDFEPQHIKIDIERTKTYPNIQKHYPELAMTNMSTARIVKKTITSGKIHGLDFYKEPIYVQDNTNKIDWLQEFLEDTDETVVVFYKYNVELEQLEELAKKLKKKYIVLNGANKEKYNDVKTKQYDLVLGQFAAAGEGIDGLQYKSHIVVYFAMPESSIEYIQSKGRIDRHGQEFVPMYYYLVMKNTIDSKIYDMLQSKIEFSEEVLNRLCLEEVENEKS